MSLLTKLRFTDRFPLVLLKAPPECAFVFKTLKVTTSIAGKELHQIMLFVENKKALDTIYNKITTKLANDAVFWIAYPKQSSGIPSDLIRNAGWEIVFNSDYRIVSSAAINEDWSAVRVGRKKASDQYISSVPMEERQVKGIDYVNRRTTLPADALKAMKPYKGLDDFFYSMGFTHQREHIEAIEGAKKPETRQRRIEKMLEMVQQMKSQKENKNKK